MFDTSMRYLAVSHRFLHDYHIDAKTIVLGRSHYEVFPEVPESWRTIHDRVLAGETLSGEAEPFLLHNGSVALVRWEMAPWRQADDTIGGAILFSEDETELKAFEAALRDSETRLRLAQKMEAIGRLAAGVAHDFNNVLQAVTASLELMLCDIPQDAPGREFAEVAMRSTKRGAYLTHHLLAYARKQMLRPRSVEVAPLLSEMELLLSRTLGQHITIKVRIDRVLARIHVDPNELQTALLNLAINASHAMPERGLLSLDARMDSDGSERVVITVSDTGTGMDEATLAQAFEPFFTTKGNAGTGLGLPMVQGFAEQSGGELRIESARGKGTKVELLLPVAPRAINPDPPEAAAAKPLRGSGRILLVDDVPEVLTTAGEFLRRAGFEVVLAAGFDEAIAFLASGKRFDALVSDYGMPGMNGVELIKRAHEAYPGLAAMVISGSADQEGIEVLPDSVAVLRKPFDQAQLVEAVLRIVEQLARQADPAAR
jgi:signal transduction histidine kinase/CheY-like chemotaxis protein